MVETENLSIYVRWWLTENKYQFVVQVQSVVRLFTLSRDQAMAVSLTNDHSLEEKVVSAGYLPESICVFVFLHMLINSLIV